MNDDFDSKNYTTRNAQVVCKYQCVHSESKHDARARARV
jgi:hypothetical protein